MGDIAVHVEGLGKRYRLGAAPASRTAYDAIAAALHAPFRRRIWGRNPRQPDTIWALKDITFDLRRGEVLGVIGRNGAGKSTLLKILSRITEPTEGAVDLYGRVSALLEVGTGFHPELSGRENIFLNGTILGMRRAEIAKKFDQIVDFAEIERFLDTPVKHYSSGMFVRLAFAVAAHLEPEILLVDEVLAVGDAAFQKRCLGKMGDVARGGRTILFVSHNLHAISTLTRRTILLDAGRMLFDGDTPSALRHYRVLWSEKRGPEGESYMDPAKVNGVTLARVVTSEPNQVHRYGEPLACDFEVAFAEAPRTGTFSFQILDEQAKPIAHLWLSDSDRRWSRAGRVRLRCVLQRPRLYMGRYYLVTHLSDRGSMQHFETLEGICPFEVVMDGIYREYPWMPGTCTYLEDAEWSTG